MEISYLRENGFNVKLERKVLCLLVYVSENVLAKEKVFIERKSYM